MSDEKDRKSAQVVSINSRRKKPEPVRISEEEDFELGEMVELYCSKCSSNSFTMMNVHGSGTHVMYCAECSEPVGGTYHHFPEMELTVELEDSEEDESEDDEEE